MDRQSLEEDELKLLEEKECIRNEIARLDMKLIEINRKISDKRKQIINFKRYENLDVSDHAIVRWMERKEGVDINEIKNKILTDAVRKQASMLRADGTYQRRVIKAGMIVTVLE